MQKTPLLFVSLVLSLAACQKQQNLPATGLTQPALTSSKAITTNSGGTNTCTTIQSFSVKEGKKVSATFVHTIQVSYSVKPCNTSQTLGVTILITNYNTGELEYESSYGPLSGKQTYFGATIGLHRVIIQSVDQNTGSVIESQQTVVAVTSQGA